MIHEILYKLNAGKTG